MAEAEYIIVACMYWCTVPVHSRYVKRRYKCGKTSWHIHVLESLLIFEKTEVARELCTFARNRYIWPFLVVQNKCMQNDLLMNTALLTCKVMGNDVESLKWECSYLLVEDMESTVPFLRTSPALFHSIRKWFKPNKLPENESLGLDSSSSIF
jgi:hypothetical protein